MNLLEIDSAVLISKDDEYTAYPSSNDLSNTQDIQ